MSGRHRVPPRRELSRREPHGGERERHLVHPQLGVDQHVQLLGTKSGCDGRRKRVAAYEGTHAVGTRGNRRRDRVGRGGERIDADLETLAIEVGDPAREVAAHRALTQERGDESDANLSSGDGLDRQRCTPRGIDAIERTRRQRGVASLRRTVVLALIGEQEVAPDEPVGDLAPARSGRAHVELTLEHLESVHESGTLARDVGCVGVDHRKRQIRAQRCAQIARVLTQRDAIGLARLLRIAALAEHHTEIEHVGGARVGRELGGAQVESCRLVE